MLQRMKENLEPLSPRTLAHPVAFCQVMLTEADDHCFKVNPEDVPLMEGSNQVAQRLLYQGCSPQKMSAFKFSVSRLPKWAQAKVTSPAIVPRNPECSSPQEEAKVSSPLFVDDQVETQACTEIQTPIKDDLGCSNSCLESLSKRTHDSDRFLSSDHKTHHSVTKEEHWLTVYTVCHILNSPELQTLYKQTKTASSNPLQDLLQLPTNEKLCIGNCVDVEAVREKGCHEPLGIGAPEKLLSDKIGSKVERTVIVPANHQKCEESELFKQHFSNLSTIQKVRSKESSVMRRYSSRYVVRRNHLEDGKKLFDTPVQDRRGKTLKGREESASDVKVEDLTFPAPIDSCEQELKNSEQITTRPSCAVAQVESTKSPLSGNLKNVILEEARDSKECRPPIGSEVQESIAACREALLKLDAAAESAVQLFSKLGALVHKDEVAGEPGGAQLYDAAATLLPSISEKVNAVAKLVSSQRNTVEVPGYEPLLGTFAESLSQKVMEILQRNLRTDSHV